MPPHDPFSTILWFHRRGQTVEEILERYPQLRPSDVYDALAYAHDHLAEIERDLAADDEVANEARDSFR